MTNKTDLRISLCLVALFLLGASTSNQPVSVDRLSHVLIEPTASQFYAANPPPGGSNIFAGSVAAGVDYSGGKIESWNGSNAVLSLQGADTRHGMIVHTTGTQGMAFIGWSSTGSQALKGIQDTYFTSPVESLFRQGATSSTDAPELFVQADNGVADLAKFEGSGGTTRLDSNAAFHPPHLTDTQANPDSYYFSTTVAKLCYKDATGVVYPLYGTSAPASITFGNSSVTFGDTSVTFGHN